MLQNKQVYSPFLYAYRTSFPQSNRRAEIPKHLGGQSLTTTTSGIPLESVISLPSKVRNSNKTHWYGKQAWKEF